MQNSAVCQQPSMTACVSVLFILVRSLFPIISEIVPVFSWLLMGDS